MENSTCDDGSGSLCRQHTHIFLENPDDMLSISVNPSFLPIVITHSFIFLFGVIGNAIAIITWSGPKTNSAQRIFKIFTVIKDFFILNLDVSPSSYIIHRYYINLNKIDLIITETRKKSLRFIDKSAQRIFKIFTVIKDFFILNSDVSPSSYIIHRYYINLNKIDLIITETRKKNLRFIDKRSPTYTFLVSLAVADVFFLLMYLPLEILGYFVITWDAGETVCKLRSYIEMLTGMASVLNLTAISIERFLVISYPLMATRFCTLNNCRIGLSIVWGLAIFLALPVCFSKEIHPFTYHNNVTSVTAYYCWDSTQDVAFHIAVYQLIAMFVVPAIFMTLCYTCVIRELWSSTRRVAAVTRPKDENEEGKCSSSNQTIESKKKVIKMLILVIILFHGCWGPRLILNVIIKHGLSTFTVHIYRLRVAAYLLSFLHSAINPIIYGFMSAAFRHVMFQCCKDGFCCNITCCTPTGENKGNHPHNPTDLDSYMFSSLSDSTWKSKQLNSIDEENSVTLTTV